MIDDEHTIPQTFAQRRSRQIEFGLLVVILFGYLVLVGLYAERTPDWQVPDEPAHYNYIRQIADNGEMPVLEMGDWNQRYQDDLTARYFDPDLTECTDPVPGYPCPGLDAVQYEDHQPPLYYLLMTPFFASSDGNLTTLRLWSARLGAVAVLCAWVVVRLLFPPMTPVPGSAIPATGGGVQAILRRVLALAAAGFVAFLPQRLAIMASVSNDSLAELIVALTLVAGVAYLGRAEMRRPHPVILGVLVGLALITKTTIYFLAGVAVLAVLLRWRRERWAWPVAARHLAYVLVPALVIGGVWWVRNLSEYGGLDFTGLARHDEVTVGQPRTDDYIDEVHEGSTGAYLEDYAETTFHSFWGQFGWMALPMPTNVYRVLLLFTLVVLVGAVIFAWRGPHDLDAPARDGLVILVATVVLVVAAYVIYNLTFVQFQGRYLYPALIPLALLVGAGLVGWFAPLAERAPVLVWGPVLVMFGLGAFAFYALENYIVPNLPLWE